MRFSLISKVVKTEILIFELGNADAESRTLGILAFSIETDGQIGFEPR
jgi:hypothetical protein